MRVIALVSLGLAAAIGSLFGQTSPVTSTAAPQPKSISPSAQGVSPGMMYHHVYVISPLMGSGKAGDPQRPIFAPAAPPQPGAQGTAAQAAPSAPASHSGLLGFQMQLSDDHQTALVEMVFSDPIAFQAVMQQEATNRGISVPANPAGTSPAAVSASLTNALQSAVPGLQIFERGKATDAQILSAFQQYKASFSFAGTTVRPQ